MILDSRADREKPASPFSSASRGTSSSTGLSMGKAEGSETKRARNSCRATANHCDPVAGTSGPVVESLISAIDIG